MSLSASAAHTFPWAKVQHYPLRKKGVTFWKWRHFIGWNFQCQNHNKKLSVKIQRDIVDSQKFDNFFFWKRHFQKISPQYFGKKKPLFYEVDNAVLSRLTLCSPLEHMLQKFNFHVLTWRMIFISNGVGPLSSAFATTLKAIINNLKVWKATTKLHYLLSDSSVFFFFLLLLRSSFESKVLEAGKAKVSFRGRVELASK